MASNRILSSPSCSSAQRFSLGIGACRGRRCLADGAEGRVVQGNEEVFTHDPEEPGPGDEIFNPGASEISKGSEEIGFGVIHFQAGLPSMAIAGLGHIEEPLHLRDNGFEPLDDMHSFIHPVDGVAGIEGNPVKHLFHLEFGDAETAFGLRDLAFGDEAVENRNGQIEAGIKAISRIVLIEVVVTAPAGIALEIQAGFVARFGDGDKLLEDAHPARTS